MLLEINLNSNKNKSFRFQIVDILFASFPSYDEDKRPGQSLSSVFSRKLGTIDTAQHALIKNICFGVFRHYYFLEALLEQNLQKPLKNKDYDIYYLLLAASYELIF